MPWIMLNYLCTNIYEIKYIEKASSIILKHLRLLSDDMRGWCRRTLPTINRYQIQGKWGSVWNKPYTSPSWHLQKLPKSLGHLQKIANKCSTLRLYTIPPCTHPFPPQNNIVLFLMLPAPFYTLMFFILACNFLTN